MSDISFRRFLAVLRKEWIQVRRDPMTLRLIIALPLMQLFLFGYAINSDPKHLPTGVISAGHSQYERTLIAALENTGYYDIRPLASEAEGEKALAEGELLFVLNIPPDFDRSVDRGEKPTVLMDADATDPTAIGNATAALTSISAALTRDLPPTLRERDASPPFRFELHARYNPEQLTVLNIVPGLICVVLTFSTLIITTLSITRERERGTMENLLAMPVRPIEVMLAKIVPYVAIGYLQVMLILAFAALVFQVPIRGSIVLLVLALGLFIASNLALGFTFSTIATNQMQAQQMAQFALMPSILLSGFMFPFQGMPGWAQFLGELIPITHALRLTRGVLLKGNGMAEILPQLWPIALFTLVIGLVAIWFYRETLD
ncbi:ABC-2 type transport system permease protein [Rhizobiales bacterium GAS191]|jgi:ABC-type multidrug transport system permease subunit|nr:ABC-2 type transport system permease protein [Rhizobiales bacterium GAS113]SEC62847.1 ABC-2 type transport system permease protein [Rhizobiales bacterium GAS188]SEC66128.1 ABC-2 type transport system permease protein [Rhizobiales bacterium GAS191]